MKLFASTNDGSNRNSLIRVICYTFAPLVFFTFLSFTQITKKRTYTQIIILGGFAGLVLHIAMPETYQVLRGFAYLWGVLYLSSMIFIQDIVEYVQKIFSRKLIYIALVVVLPGSILFANVKSFSNNFFTVGPSIPGEVAYYEFDNAFKYMQKDLQGKELLTSSYNLIPDMFYDLPSKYVINIDHKLDNRYYPDDVVVLKSITAVSDLAKTKDVCIILRDFSYRDLLNADFMTYLINNYSLRKTTVGYEVWCER